VKKKTLRLVFVGYGSVGEQLARLLSADACCRPVAVVDPNRRALDKATSLYQLSTFPALEKALAATDADVAVINTTALAETALAKARQRRLHFAPDAFRARDYLKELEAALRGKAPGRASRENR
jgi:predicted dinucleotide-utilizing enzyme